MLLPADNDISERSLKFYNGTYTLKSDGFVDEVGVYRAFDCYEPTARAPTPLPPMFLTEPARDEPRDLHTRIISTWTGEKTTFRQRCSSELPTVSLRKASIKTSRSNQRSASPAQFTFASDCIGGNSVTILEKDLFPGYEDRERLIGKVEGMQLVHRQAGTGISLAECYKLCGMAYPEEVQSTETGRYIKRETTSRVFTETVKNAEPAISPLSEPPDSVRKLKTPTKGKQEPSISPLSDCPSDLSNWDVGEMMKKSNVEMGGYESKNVSKLETSAKRSTRGIAQKVRKVTKKPSAAPASKSLQRNGGRSRQRSTRKTRSHDDE